MAGPSTGYVVFAAATDAECDHLVMGRCEVAQAVELVRALRHELHEMTTQLARVERQGVGKNSRACAMRMEAAALRRDIHEARFLIERLERRYLGWHAVGIGSRAPSKPVRH